jgi:hypothetical protein
LPEGVGMYSHLLRRCQFESAVKPLRVNSPIAVCPPFLAAFQHGFIFLS